MRTADRPTVAAMRMRVPLSLSLLDLSRAPPHIYVRAIYNSSLSTSSSGNVASGTTDGTADRLNHGQPAASVREDKRRERLDFSVTEIATDISEQLFLPLSMDEANTEMHIAKRSTHQLLLTLVAGRQELSNETPEDRSLPLASDSYSVMIGFCDIRGATWTRTTYLYKPTIHVIQAHSLYNTGENSSRLMEDTLPTFLLMLYLGCIR